MRTVLIVAAAIAFCALASVARAQDDLADYPIKEEQCENFGECLTECVKKLPPNRQFTEILDCSDACAVTNCKEVIVEDATLASLGAPPEEVQAEAQLRAKEEARRQQQAEKEATKKAKDAAKKSEEAAKKATETKKEDSKKKEEPKKAEKKEEAKKAEQPKKKAEESKKKSEEATKSQEQTTVKAENKGKGKIPSFGKKDEPKFNTQQGAEQMGVAKGANLLPGNGQMRMKQMSETIGIVTYPKHDTFVGRVLDLYGEFNRDAHELLSQVLRPGDVVIDAGAGFGVSALVFSKVVGSSGSVHAFEAQRVLSQLVCSNAATNQASNIRCINKALGASKGEIVVPELDLDQEGNHGSTSLDPSNINGEPVDVTTVDSLNLQKCRLIKIDTEGMEAEVLQGAIKTIKQFKPALYYKAVYDEEANVLSPKTQAAARLVKGLKYDQYWHFSRRFVEDNYFGNSDNVFGDTSDLYIFAVPSGGSKIEGLEELEVPDE